MKLSAFLVACVLASAAHAQNFTIIPSNVPAPLPPGGWSIPGPRPEGGALVNVDLPALKAVLAAAPAQRFDAPLAEYGLLLDLPGPDGRLVPCIAAESPVMEQPLQERYPQLRTYIVQTVDGAASGRFELTPKGLTAMLRTAEHAHDETGNCLGARTWMIDAWNSGDPAHAVSYYLDQLTTPMDWRCETTEGVHGVGAKPDDHDAAPRGPRELQTLRTVRLGIACTGEWGVHQSEVQGHAPNAVDPLAAIVVVTARTNVVYEADLAVHFNLIANNDLVVYFDPLTDPYPDSCDGTGGSDCSGPYLAPNISNFSTVIGNANFDIGHLLTRVFGGVAYLSAVCGDNKAGGISGIPRGGDVDPLSALVVIHEIGHQFGANHTFSGTRGRCAGNVRLASAWEAGSGSSPMAYAGGCPVGDAPPSDNVAIFADPFFHHGSVREMQNFLNRAQTTCPVLTTSGNNLPVIISNTPDIAVPPSTPFVLSVNATDSDGDTLTYSWEQFDSGVARPLSGEGSLDNGAGALFRAFPPVTSPQRTFPRMADILSGVPTPGEQLPSVTGVSRRFRVIVRDNSPGAGGVAISSFVDLDIPSGTSAFAVTLPVEDSIVSPGPNTINWTVGNTNVAPISCASVTIRLSTDDGLTFPHTLGNFANNGAAAVVIPKLSGQGRVRIDANGEIFFAVSRSFTLGPPCAADFNHNGTLDSQDFFDFIAAFFAEESNSDFNRDTFINSQDFFDFLGAFFAGC